MIKKDKIKSFLDKDGKLIVTEYGNSLHKREDYILVKSNNKIISEIQKDSVIGLFIQDRGVTISSDLLSLCVNNEIPVFLVDFKGKIQASLISTERYLGEMTLIQYRERNSNIGLHLAKMFTLGKVKNQFYLLKRYFKNPLMRDTEFGRYFTKCRNELENIVNKILELQTDSEPDKFRMKLFGLEGIFASYYWTSVRLILCGKVDFCSRKKRNAKDLINSSLNYGYGILYGIVSEAILTAGLNPAIGFLHFPEKHKNALVFDLIEEFRTYLVDRAVFTLIRRGEELIIDEEGSISASTRRKISRKIANYLESNFIFERKKLTLKRLIFEKAKRIKDFLIGNCIYKPFVFKW